MRLRGLFTLLLALLPLRPQAPGAHPAVTYGPEQGLPGGAILALMQDRRGHVWAGTEEGLYRHDGRRFRGVGEAQGLTGAVTALVEETGGTALWVGTARGLFRVEGLRVAPHGTEGVEALREDGSGRIWMATRQGLRVGGLRGFAPASGFPDGIGALALAPSAKDGSMWAAAADGRLFRMTPGGAWPAPSAPDPIEALAEDLQGRLWARTRRALLRLSPSGTWEDFTRRLPGPAVGRSALHLDGRGRLWIPTGSGVLSVDGEWWSPLAMDPAAASPRCVLVDREGVAWVGGDQLYRLAGGEAWTVFRGGTGVAALHQDGQGRLWAGGAKGLSLLGPAGFSAGPLPAEGTVQALALGPDGRLWAGGRPAARLLAAGPTGNVGAYSVQGLGAPGDVLSALAFDGADVLHAGLKERGLFRILPSAAGYIAQPVPGAGQGSVHAMAADGLGRFWVAGSWGLSVASREGTWRRFSPGEGLPGEPRCLAPARDGSLWVGFRGSPVLQRVGYGAEGLRYLERVDLSACPGAGLPVSLGEDPQGGLWIGTTSGLVRWDQGALERQGRDEGMPGEECLPGALWVARDGDLWVGTSGGLGHLDRSRAADPLPPPAVVFTEIRFGEARLEGWSGGPVEVRGSQSAGEFAFAALSTRAPGRLRYEIRLAGEDDWRPVSGSPVVYPSLPPGDHRLEVRARLGRGPWGPPARLDLSLAAVGWQGWPFRAAVGLVLLLLLWRVYRWRMASLERRTRDLVRQVDSRTQDLRAALSEAEEATRVKGDFLATMSHEIRTPMNAILGLTGMLLETPLRGDQREHAESVRRSAKALLGILNDVLDLSKLEAGKLVLHAGPLDLRELLEEALDLLAVQAHEKDLALLLRYPLFLPRSFVGDADRIRQVLLNLLGNAIKFTERGHVKVSVSQVPSPEGGTLMEIAVEDTGIGIPAALQAPLFEKFSQADSGIARRFGGTGLGLAICRHLVDVMGGRIGLQSTEGRGSRFWVTLPLPALATPVEEEGPSAHRRELRVMLVDPLPESRELLQEMLSHWRVEHLGVATPAEAWEHMASARRVRRPFHLVLVDASLEAAAVLARPHPESREAVVPILPIHQPQDIPELRRQGFRGILHKPVYAWSLAELLDQALRLSAGHGPDWIGAGEEEITAVRPLDPVKPFRVLLVEDNPLNRTVALHHLEALGATVAVAEEGRQGVQQALGSAFDVVLMDCQMPGMDGFEAAKAIRRGEQELRRLPAPILAMTAHALPGARERAREAGMDAFLLKPFEREDLVAALAEVLPDRFKPGVALPPAPADPSATLDWLRLQHHTREPGSLAELVQLFHQHAPGHLARLRTALETGDAPALAQAAHALKGCCAYLYAEKLGGLCADLETLAAQGRLDTAARFLESAEAEFPKVVAALEEVSQGSN